MSRYPCDTKVYVGDLGNHARKNELEDSFSYYGPLRSVWIARNPPGFAFVEFESARDAEDAVRALDGRMVSIFKMFLKTFPVSTWLRLRNIDFFHLHRFVVVVPVLKFPVVDLDVDSVAVDRKEEVRVETNRVNNIRQNEFQLNIYLFFL